MDTWRAAIDPEEVLRHGPWLREIARALLRDPASADDAAQETWLRLGRRPDVGGEGLRPFLAGTVRRVASEFRRTAGRRAVRETEAARADRAPPEERVVEQLELQELVARTLRELDEPYRSTLTMRYLQELDAAEIARRTDVPAGTVRARVARGLELLRERLERRFGRDWRQALCSIALPDRAASSAALAAKGVIAVVIGKWLAACGFVVLGVAALSLAFRVEPARAPASAASTIAGTRDSTARLGEVEVAGARRVSPELHAEPTPQPSASPPEPRADVRIVACAVDDRGEPLAGARIAFGALERESSAPSGRDGRLEWTIGVGALVGLESGRVARVEVRREGFATVEFERELEFGRTLWLGDVELRRAGTLEGRVVAAGGAVVAGATVLATQERAATEFGPAREVIESARTGESDADGAFRFEGLPLGYWTLWASTPQRPWVSRADVLVTSDGGEPVIVELGDVDPSHVIAGIVLDPRGAPVTGARVALFDANGETSWELQRITGAGGRFDLRLAATGAAFELRAFDRERLWPEIVREVRSGDAELALRFRESALLTVRVVDDHDGPIAGATVYAFGADRTLFPGCDGTTGADGSVDLPQPTLEYSVLATAPGFARRSVGAFAPSGAPHELTLALSPGAAIRGRVLANGAPVAGARVRLSACAEPGQLFEPSPAMPEVGTWLELIDPRPEAAVETGVDGAFALFPPRGTVRELAGGYCLVAEASGLAAAHLGPRTWKPNEAVDGLELALTRGGAIEGTLLATHGESPEGWDPLESTCRHASLSIL